MFPTFQVADADPVVEYGSTKGEGTCGNSVRFERVRASIRAKVARSLCWVVIELKERRLFIRTWYGESDWNVINSSQLTLKQFFPTQINIWRVGFARQKQDMNVYTVFCTVVHVQYTNTVYAYILYINTIMYA